MNQFNINDTFLGKNIQGSEHYNPSLLFRIPRSENRVQYNILNEDLPFTGYDVWNCYELSFLTSNGLPVSRVAKIIYPAESEFLVESKSLKLYLNSFNMERFEGSIIDTSELVKKIIEKDLSTLLTTNVKVVLFDTRSNELTPFKDDKFSCLTDQVSFETLEKIEFSRFLEAPDLLESTPYHKPKEYAFRTDLLRSNCRVTNQPDWGDLFVQMTTNQEINLASIVSYLVSFRKENHFHEEVVEMIYKRFLDKFNPSKLMVAAMYTRRGGIDINPIRASHTDLIDEAFISEQYRLSKTIRQ